MKHTRVIEKTWFRLLPAIIGGLLLLLAAAGAAVAIRWRVAVKNPADPVLLGEPRYEFADGAEPVIGTRFQAILKYRLPWSCRFKQTIVDPGKDLQTTSEPSIRRTGIGWGYSTWTVTVPLQACSFGKCGGGAVTADFYTGKKVEAQLPELEFAKLDLPDDDSGEDLQLAPSIETKENGFSWLDASAIACIIVLVSLAVWMLLLDRKPKKTVPVRPPWEVALEDIQTLREQVRDGSLQPEPALASLTDVVRRYLEKRFRLRAERQTTPEFLADLESGTYRLEEKDRGFLRSFLAAADMVKFARFPSDPEMFCRTSFKAEELVSGTIPPDDAGRKYIGEDA